jgi:hypothetical protein
MGEQNGKEARKKVKVERKESTRIDKKKMELKNPL